MDANIAKIDTMSMLFYKIIEISGEGYILKEKFILINIIYKAF